MTLVKKEFVRRHCTEVRLRQIRKFIANPLQAGCRTFSGNRPRPATAGTGKSEMRSEGAGVALESQGPHRIGRCFCQSLQFLVAFDSSPEHTRRLRIGEEPRAAKRQRNRRTFQLFERTAYFVELLRLTQELQRDVKRLRPDPARLGSEYSHLVAKCSDAVADVRIDVEGYKEAHGLTSPCDARDRAPVGWPTAGCVRGHQGTAAARLRFWSRQKPRQKPGRRAFPRCRLSARRCP